MKLCKNATAALAGAVVGLGMTVSAIGATWDMPTPYPDKTFHTVNIAAFAEEVAKATNGKLEIKIHSAGSLFKHPEIKNAVRGGQVPIGEFFMSLTENDWPIFGADSQPFLATTFDEAQKLWEAQKPVVTELLDKAGMVPLFSVTWPPQGLYTKKPINTVDDLKGVKFRTYNATLELFANKLGAAPTQVEVPDIPQAFATGRVEAMITSPSTGVNSKAWDFVTHYTDIKAWLPKNIVVVNKRAFRALDEETRQAVLAAAAAAEARGWEMSKKETEEQTKVLAENGIVVVTPSAELMDGLKAIGASMMEAWQKTAGSEGAAVLQAFQAK